MNVSSGHPAARSARGCVAGAGGRWGLAVVAGCLAGSLALAGVSARAAAEALRVEVSGVSGKQKANVEAFLSIFRERESPRLREGRLRRLHEQAPAEIRTALEPFGLYGVEVTGELERAAEGGWVARYQVEPGEPITTGLVDIRLSGEGSTELELPAVELKGGQPFTHAAYEAAKGALRRFAQDRGYLDARYAISQAVVDPEAYRVDVSLHLDTGPRYYYGELRFAQEGFDPGYLSRFVDFKPGDPYRFSQLIGLQGALYSTDHFSHVEVVPLLDATRDQRVPIEVRLTRNKPNRYRVGLGYATDTGVRVSFDWTRRYIGSHGHSAHALLSVSPVFQKLELDYAVPLRDPRKEVLSFVALLENYDTDSRQGYVASVGARHNRFRGNWQRTLGLQYDYDAPRGTDEDPAFSLVPSVTWIWKVFDDPLYTRSGALVNLNFSGAAEQLLSSSSFFQGRIRTKGIYAPFEKFRVIGRVDVGASLADDVLDIPQSRRFYAGGDNSVRGYDFEGLSPVDDDGEPTGGENVFTASIELERKVSEQWAVAAFYDTGNAFNDWDDLDLASGAGVGVRWFSPVGLVRIDVATPLDEGEDGYRFYLAVGPDL